MNYPQGVFSKRPGHRSGVASLSPLLVAKNRRVIVRARLARYEEEEQCKEDARECRNVNRATEFISPPHPPVLCRRHRKPFSVPARITLSQGVRAIVGPNSGNSRRPIVLRHRRGHRSLAIFSALRGMAQTCTSTALRRSLPAVTADSRAFTTTASNFDPVRARMRSSAYSRSIADW